MLWIIAACVLALFLLTLLLPPSPGVDVMRDTARETRVAVLGFIPLDSEVGVAERVMADAGFKCAHRRGDTYADTSETTGAMVSRGPADVLYCDSGDRMTGAILVSKRWQVMFEHEDGTVTHVAVGVGSTGL